mmetsp:Transcript_21515/g.52346  ORF Transcript_21515/g.52346 Transcript_21515/m.52346 type:complete len:215 (+) Transcript_21515:1643-2287(+)
MVRDSLHASLGHMRAVLRRCIVGAADVHVKSHDLSIGGLRKLKRGYVDVEMVHEIYVPLQDRVLEMLQDLISGYRCKISLSPLLTLPFVLRIPNIARNQPVKAARHIHMHGIQQLSSHEFGSNDVRSIRLHELLHNRNAVCRRHTLGTLQILFELVQVVERHNAFAENPPVRLNQELAATKVSGCLNYLAVLKSNNTLRDMNAVRPHRNLRFHL